MLFGGLNLCPWSNQVEAVDLLKMVLLLTQSKDMDPCISWGLLQLFHSIYLCVHLKLNKFCGFGTLQMGDLLITQCMTL